MVIKTKPFQEAANKILLATSLDKNAGNLELVTKGTNLFLNVTNKEFYCSIKFLLENEVEQFRAVVDASLFLSLIAGLTTDTFSLDIAGNAVSIKTGKSSYKLAMIYENESLMKLPIIAIQNKTVEMPISHDILQSILLVNSKEVQKVKNIDVNPLQKLYYIDETGCFTFTDSACLNSFTLEKPVKLVLTDKVVSLFRLFKEDVLFSLGQDQIGNGIVRTKVTFETSDIYVAAIIPSDDTVAQIQVPCSAAKTHINNTYPHHLVLSANDLAAAISRLMLFTKNSVEKANMSSIPATVKLTNDEFILTDNFGNSEAVPVENGSYVDEEYEMRINIIDLKSVVDSSKNEHITLNCGNHRAVVIAHGSAINLIPERKR